MNVTCYVMVYLDVCLWVLIYCGCFTLFDLNRCL